MSWGWRNSNFIIILHGSNYSVIKSAFQTALQYGNIIRNCNSGIAERGISQRERREEEAALRRALPNAELLKVQSVDTELQSSSLSCDHPAASTRS